MAASAVNNGLVAIRGGQTGKLMEYGYITFDADATVNVKTVLRKLVGASFTPTGTAGDAAMLSVGLTFTAGIASVPATGLIAVGAAGTSTTTWLYQFLGE